MIRLAVIAIAVALTAGPALAQETPSPAGAELYFVTPRDGETVESPVRVIFGLRGMGVAPAGAENPNTGHHHLIINAPLPKLDEPIPADDNHRHFGGGQTEVDVELAPGQHTLQLILGDWSHIPHDPPVTSEQITITVK